HSSSSILFACNQGHVLCYAMLVSMCVGAHQPRSIANRCARTDGSGMTAQNHKVAKIAGHHQPATPATPDYDRRLPLETRVLRVVQRIVKRRAQRILWHLIGAIGYMIRRRHPSTTPLLAGDPSVRRILLVRVDLLGDTVLTTPAIAALRRGYPKAQIDMLVQQSTASVLAGEHEIAHVITYNPQIWGQ